MRPVAVLGVLLVFLPVAADPPAVAPPPRPATGHIEDLVRLLGSDDFAERERATLALSTLDLNGLPPSLLLATQSPDPEVRKRAAAAVTALRRRAAQLARGRQAAFARSGKIDLFVASAGAWHLPADDDRVWQTVLDVAADIDRRAEYRWALTGRRATIPTETFWLVCLKPRFVRSAVPFEVPAKGDPDPWWPGGVIAPSVTAAQSLTRTLILSRGPVRPARGIAESVVLANGNVSASAVETSVVVCDGNVDVVGRAYRSVVAARGDITVDSATACTFVAAGRVTIRDVKPPVNPRVPPVVMTPGARNAFGFVTFFELSRVGVEVAEADKVVRVKAVAAGSAFAAGGAKVGDVVEGVNGAKPDSAESLRRLLRDALALGDATVTVRRGDGVHSLKVTLPE